MCVIYCICPLPRYTDIICVLLLAGARLFICLLACQPIRVRCNGVAVVVLSFFYHRHSCRLRLLNIRMCRFYFAHFSVLVLYAKISFSINLSAIMVFANKFRAWENVCVVLYQFRATNFAIRTYIRTYEYRKRIRLGRQLKWGKKTW